MDLSNNTYITSFSLNVGIYDILLYTKQTKYFNNVSLLTTLNILKKEGTVNLSRDISNNTFILNSLNPLLITSDDINLEVFDSNNNLYQYEYVNQTFIDGVLNNLIFRINDAQLTIGYNTIYCSFVTTNYTYFSNNISIDIAKQDFSMNLLCLNNSITYKENTTFQVNVNTQDESIINGFIIFMENDKYIDTIKLVNNLALIDLSFNYADNINNVKAVFLENDKFNTNERSLDLININKNSNLTMDISFNSLMYLYDNIDIHIKLSDMDINTDTLNGGHIQIYDSSALLFNEVSVINGLANINLLLLKTNYNLNIVFTNSNNYLDISRNRQLININIYEITHYYTNLLYSYSNNKYTMTIGLTGNANVIQIPKLLNSGYFQITMPNKIYNVNLSNGGAHIILPQLASNIKYINSLFNNNISIDII
jgi:hypothetical protein